MTPNWKNIPLKLNTKIRYNEIISNFNKVGHMSNRLKQSGMFKGVYEFEDPSGGLLAAKVPFSGSADLYNGTVIIVRPNQRAMLIYKGQRGDILKPGTHVIKTENVPILTRLANWKFAGRSPLRCEIWFFSGNVHTSKRWGTASPVMSSFNNIGTIPIRTFGTYNIRANSPIRMYEKLIGSRNSLDISTVEEFVQGQVIELIPEALKIIDEIVDLNRRQDEVSKILEKLVQKELNEYGLTIRKIQIQSLLPPDDVMEALESKIAMDLIGDPKKFLLYKTANSLEALGGGDGNGQNDAMQMMMGLMLGKNMLGMEGAEVSTKQKSLTQATSSTGKAFCTECGQRIQANHKFCFNCGAQV